MPGVGLAADDLEPLVAEVLLEQLRDARGVGLAGEERDLEELRGRRSVGDRVALDHAGQLVAGADDRRGLDAELVEHELGDVALERPRLLRRGEHDVAALHERRDVLVAGLAERRAQVRHRDPVAGGEVDSAQQRDLPCHARARYRPAMVDPGVLAFARGVLPAPPARILEIGAGDGELAAALREGGHEVTAIDPKAQDGTGVEATALIDATGTYDAAIAVVSLHHVEPLEESCARLAELIVPGGVLAIDELDVDRYDERAVAWWLHQRRAAGHEETTMAPERSSTGCAATSTRSTRSARRSRPTSRSASPCAVRTCTAGTSRPACARPRSA